METVKSSLNDTNLGQWLQANAVELARAWRSEGFVDSRSGTVATALLDDVVESLIFELGRSMESSGEVSGEAWLWVKGMLRLSLSRGELVLNREFRQLALLLDRVSVGLGATDLERVRLRQLLVASHRLALVEFQGRKGGQVRSLGLSVMVFEPGDHAHTEKHGRAA